MLKSPKNPDLNKKDLPYWAGWAMGALIATIVMLGLALCVTWMVQTLIWMWS